MNEPHKPYRLQYICPGCSEEHIIVGPKPMIAEAMVSLIHHGVVSMVCTDEVHAKMAEADMAEQTVTTSGAEFTHIWVDEIKHIFDPNRNYEEKPKRKGLWPFF